MNTTMDHLPPGQARDLPDAERLMARPTVLVADDDPVFVRSVAAVLRTRYHVRTVANGTEALAAVEDDPPDLVILDVMMDHMSEGFDVARSCEATTRPRSSPSSS